MVPITRPSAMKHRGYVLVASLLRLKSMRLRAGLFLQYYVPEHAPVAQAVYSEPASELRQIREVCQMRGACPFPISAVQSRHLFNVRFAGRSDPNMSGKYHKRTQKDLVNRIWPEERYHVSRVYPRIAADVDCSGIGLSSKHHRHLAMVPECFCPCGAGHVQWRSLRLR